MNMLNSKQKVIAVIAIIAVILIIGYYYINATKSIYGYTNEEELIEEESEEEEPKENKETEEKIIVHITGAVQKEGIVKVKENARINDVIEEAGGLKEDANIKNVNLAYIVEDGQKIYIPYKTEENIEGELITDTAGKNVLETEEEQTGKVNINKASEAELQNLPGIGASTASKIVTYRKENRKI